MKLKRFIPIGIQLSPIIITWTLENSRFHTISCRYLYVQIKIRRRDIDSNCPVKHRNTIDELIYTESSETILKWFKRFISSKFDVKQSETGPLEWILGAKVFRDKSKGITSINQSVAIEKLAGKLDLLKSNPVRSPTIASPLPPP